MEEKDNFLPFGYGDSWSVIFTMSSLKGYIQLVETNMQAEADKMKLEFEKTIKDVETDKNNSDEYISHIIDTLSEEFRELDYNFKGWFRNSIIIQLYSFLEVNLTKYCENHKNRYNKEYSLRDLKGQNDLDKIAKYLKNSAEIDIKQLTQWKFIDNIRKLRNCIVHAEGRINTSNNDFRSISDFSKGRFKITNENGLPEIHQVYLDNKQFIKECISEIEGFLIQITSQT